MKEIAKYDENFDLSSAVNSNTINSLDVFEEYMDFALSTTIRKQMPEISDEQEKNWAGVLLTNYFNGDSNAFTSSFGIRKNISACDEDKIIQMFLKQAVEKDSYRQGILHRLNTENEIEFICDDLTKKLCSFGYQDVFNIVKTNPVYQKDLIDNYVNFKYRSNIKKEISRARENVPNTLLALSNLENGMQSNSTKTSGEYQR